MVNAGGVAAVVDYIAETKGNVCLPGVMALGYIAAHSETLAMAVIVSKVCALVCVCVCAISLCSMLDPPSYSMYVFDTTYVCHLHIHVL